MVSTVTVSRLSRELSLRIHIVRATLFDMVAAIPTRTEIMAVRLTPAELAAFDRAAHGEDMARGTLARRIIVQWLRAQGAPARPE